MNATYWLIIGIVITAALCAATAVAAYGAGYDRGQADAADYLPQHARPKAGRIPLKVLADPGAGPPWAEAAFRFAGESEQGWAAESAEYEPLTRAAGAD